MKQGSEFFFNAICNFFKSLVFSFFYNFTNYIPVLSNRTPSPPPLTAGEDEITQVYLTLELILFIVYLLTWWDTDIISLWYLTRRIWFLYSGVIWAWNSELKISRDTGQIKPQDLRRQNCFVLFILKNKLKPVLLIGKSSRDNT